MPWRWRWRDPEGGPSGGREALEQAEKDLHEDRARGPEVRREVAKARWIQRRNGFGDAMLELMRSIRT